jgi:hypothetical protein
VKLDTAIDLMKNATVTSAAQKTDIVNYGNKNLWIKLANTLKLRLLIRQTNINPNPTAEIAKIKANSVDGASVLQSKESADVNPGSLDASGNLVGGYINDVGKQSPFYGAYGLLPSGQEANTFFRANDAMIDLLAATEDPRLAYFFARAKSPTNANNPYVGTVYGSDPNTAFGGDQTSNIGPGLVKSFNQSQWIVTSVESMFLQAEAIARGWDIGGPYAGNAEAAYNAAVTESFLWLGVPNAATEAMSYLEANEIRFTDATNFDEQLELIIIMKYIALTGINPLEAWNDYRRLNILQDYVPLSVLPARGSRTIPVRLLYPQSEFAVNASNVQAQGSITPQSKLFWDK